MPADRAASARAEQHARSVLAVAYWWHQVVDWLATTGRLATVTRLERPDEYGIVTHHVTIAYSPVHRNWVLRSGDDDTAMHSHVEENHSRPWLHNDQDELVAEVRELLLDGWTVASREATADQEPR